METSDNNNDNRMAPTLAAEIDDDGGGGGGGGGCDSSRPESVTIGQKRIKRKRKKKKNDNNNVDASNEAAAAETPTFEEAAGRKKSYIRRPWYRAKYIRNMKPLLTAAPLSPSSQHPIFAPVNCMFTAPRANFPGNGPVCSEGFLRNLLAPKQHTNTCQDGSRVPWNWKVNDDLNTLDAQSRDFWERPEIDFIRRRRHRKKRKPGNTSSYHLVTLAESSATVEAVEEHASEKGSSKEPDVISLSDNDDDDDDDVDVDNDNDDDENPIQNPENISTECCFVGAVTTAPIPTPSDGAKSFDDGAYWMSSSACDEFFKQLQSLPVLSSFKKMSELKHAAATYDEIEGRKSISNDGDGGDDDDDDDGGGGGGDSGRSDDKADTAKVTDADTSTASENPEDTRVAADAGADSIGEKVAANLVERKVVVDSSNGKKVETEEQNVSDRAIPRIRRETSDKIEITDNKQVKVTGVDNGGKNEEEAKQEKKISNNDSAKASLMKNGPLTVKKESFLGVNFFPGMDEFIQNGEMEVKIEKSEGRDFIHLILFECCGPPDDPKQVSRNGYKICASAVLYENTPVEIIRDAFIDLAEQLEEISRDSLVAGDKLPYKVNIYSLPYLEKEFIYPLKQKSARFTRAVYFCRMCQYHICSVSQAVSHFTSREHTDSKEKAEILEKLECLPEPAEEQMRKVECIIRERYDSRKGTKVQYEAGAQIANLLTQFLQKEAHTGYSVVLYGSYQMKLVTTTSNLNLALNYPMEYTLGQALGRVMEVLEDAKIEKPFTVHSVATDFQRADPSIRCIINSIPVVITTYCLRQQRASQLINLYCTIRPQFRILATVFRLWAEECSLTNLQLGGIPKFAFDVMLIYYLQRMGLLPFVFEILSEEEILQLDSESLEFRHQVDKINSVCGDAANEDWNLGELWIALFRHYAVQHPVHEVIQVRWKDNSNLPKDTTRWNKKRLAVEDPFGLEHIIQPQQHINAYFSSCFLSTYLHFALPRTTTHSLIPYTIITPEQIALAKKNKKRKPPKPAVSKDSNSEEIINEEQQRKESSNSDDVSALCEDVKNLQISETETAEVNVTNEEQQNKQSSNSDDVFPSPLCESEQKRIFAPQQPDSDNGDAASASQPDNRACDSGRVDTRGKVINEVTITMTEECINYTASLATNTEQQQQHRQGSAKHQEKDTVNVLKIEEGHSNQENLMAAKTGKKIQELEVSSVNDCCADTNTSGNQLPAVPEEFGKLSIGERCYDRNIMMALKTGVCDSPELYQRAKKLGLLPEASHTACDMKRYDEKSEVITEIKLASTSCLKIKFEDYSIENVRKSWMDLIAADYSYPWELHCFTSGLTPVVRCACCSAEGHLRDTCPELLVPKAADMEPLTFSQRKMIDDIIYDVFDAMRIRPYYVHYMSSLCRELEECLRRFYRPDCRLALFGSAANGFGLLGSDADICLRFGPDVKAEDIDPVEAVSKVAEAVRKMPNIAFVAEVPHAKVPIVKFRCYNRDRLEADVSLYNELALVNTRLLRAYSEVDRRIHQLGIMVKEWAKNCEIGDASKGSLSSYSYIIMLIHYLQRTTPPVAPFLQEIAPFGRRREPVIVDDCDVYFCNLHELEWRIQNHSTVGMLWMGFLDYFATKFDFNREVVQIRRAQPLAKLDKGWQSRPIAIEDPFDLNHNLSSGVHSKTMAYIMKSFVQSREAFGTLIVPNIKLPHDMFVRYASLLLRRCHVGDGPPLDRNCCHRCRQIGHFVENCPLLGLKDKKRANDVNVARNAQLPGNDRRRRLERQSTGDKQNPKGTYSDALGIKDDNHEAEVARALDVNDQNFPALIEKTDAVVVPVNNGWGACRRPPWHKYVKKFKN